MAGKTVAVKGIMLKEIKSVVRLKAEYEHCLSFVRNYIEILIIESTYILVLIDY